MTARRFQYYIERAFSVGEARVDSIDPATAHVWAEMPEARQANVDRAVR